MGFSNQSNASKTFASMKVLKDENDKSTPFFIIKHKEDGSWVEKQRFTTLTAEPYDIELGSYDYKGSPVDTVTMQMMDGIELLCYLSLPPCHSPRWLPPPRPSAPTTIDPASTRP